MENNTAIVIAKSSNGFVIFKCDVPVLPDDPGKIATFTHIGQTDYDTRTLTGFLYKHFKDDDSAES